MQTETTQPRASSAGLGLLAAAAGLFTTVATALACVGPLVAILLGIGGFGWLTRYAYLRVPATVATALILLAGFHWLYRRPRCPHHARRDRIARVLFWLATATAVSVNLFEYVVLPRLL